MLKYQAKQEARWRNLARRVLDWRSALMKDRELYSKQEFLEKIPVSLRSLERSIEKGEIKVVRFGRRVFIPRAEVDKVTKHGLPQLDKPQAGLITARA
jgi:excisionase family DNA binding protein